MEAGDGGRSRGLVELTQTGDLVSRILHASSKLRLDQSKILTAGLLSEGVFDLIPSSRSKRAKC